MRGRSKLHFDVGMQRHQRLSAIPVSTSENAPTAALNDVKM